MLEIQFQIERSCRESAEALAVKVLLLFSTFPFLLYMTRTDCLHFHQMSRENSVLKRASRLLMPLIPELPEGSAPLTSDPEVEQTANCDTVDGSKERLEDAQLLLESQAKITGQREMLFTLLKLSHAKCNRQKRRRSRVD